jgi:hypothetical protein
MLPLIMDGVVAVLLVVTIWYAVLLNRRLANLRADRDRLEQVIGALQAASHQSEAALGAFKVAAIEAGTELQASVDRAQGTRADLEFMIQKATETADRLERVVRMPREVTGPVAVEQGGAAPGAAKRPVTPLNRAADKSARIDDAKDKEAQQRLSGLLRQASGRSSREPAAAKAPPVVPETLPDRPKVTQSRTERDLQKALETRR